MLREDLYSTAREQARLRAPRIPVDWDRWAHQLRKHALHRLHVPPTLADDLASAGLEGVWLAYSDHDSPPRALAWRYGKLFMARALKHHRLNYVREQAAISRRPPFHPEERAPLPALPLNGPFARIYDLMRLGLSRPQVARALGRNLSTICTQFNKAKGGLRTLLVDCDPERFRRLLPSCATRKESVP